MRVLRRLRAGAPWQHLGVRVAAVVLLGVLPVLGVLVLGNLTARQDARQAAAADAVRVRELVAGQEEQLLAGVRLTLAALAVGDVATSSGCADVLRAVAQQHRHVVGLAVTDPSGAVTCSSEPTASSATFAGRPLLEEVVRTGEPSRGEYAGSPLHDGPVLLVGYPVGDRRDVEAVLVAAVDPDWVVHAGLEAGLPQTARLTLVDPGGVVLARHPDPDRLAGGSIAGSPALQEALRLGTGVVRASGADGVDRIWAFEPVGDPVRPAFLQVGYDVAAVEAPAVAHLRRDLALAGVVTALALAGAYVLTSLLLRRPVNRLLAATRRLTAGDLTARYGRGRTTAGGEIGELGASFDEMAQTLQDRQADLVAAEARFRAAFDHAPTGMVLAGLLGEGSGDDGGEDGGGRIISSNAALADLVGVDPEDLAGRSVLDLYHPDDHAAVRVEHQALARGEVDTVEAERRLLRENGSVLWVRRVASAVPDAHGRRRLVIAQLENVTERREALAELSHRATHDGLTGLPNRTLAFDRIEHARARSQRTGSRFALLFCDLDRFKAVNDSYGHAAGDALLQVTADRLLTVVRGADTAARLAGDEFLVCAEDLPAEPVAAEQHALELAHRLSGVLGRPVELDGHVLHPGVSIGVVVPDVTDLQVSELVSDADSAMYAAKRFGSGVQLFTPHLRRRGQEWLDLEAELHEVLDPAAAGGSGHLTVHYQPIVDLRDGRVSAAEALVRWQHPERGLLLPASFLPVAEQTGLVAALGERVLEQVAADQSSWAEASVPLRVTVNVSARQLAGPSLAVAVERCLRGNPLGAGGIWLEVTETTLVQPTDATSAELGALRALGVTLGVDDFGTGYASLSALRRLPVGFVKIDRSFVSGIADDAADAAVVRGVLAMAAGMGLTVVAEGVETQAQVVRLQELGCTYVQGYLTGRPMPAGELLVLMTEQTEVPTASAGRGTQLT